MGRKQIVSLFSLDLTLLTIVLTIRASIFKACPTISDPELRRRRQRQRRRSATNRAFSHDVTAAILVFQNNKTAAMLVCQENPLGVELFSYVNVFFCPNKFA